MRLVVLKSGVRAVLDVQRLVRTIFLTRVERDAVVFGPLNVRSAVIYSRIQQLLLGVVDILIGMVNATLLQSAHGLREGYGPYVPVAEVLQEYLRIANDE